MTIAHGNDDPMPIQWIYQTPFVQIQHPIYPARRREDPVDPGRGVIAGDEVPDVPVTEHGPRANWGGARRYPQGVVDVRAAISKAGTARAVFRCRG